MTARANIYRIKVRISEIKVAKGDAILVSYGLGSCVAVAIFDPKQEVGGLAHVLLPGAPRHEDNPLKFSESALELLVEEISRMGGSQNSMIAKIVGGANMFPWTASDKKKAIGERNVDAVLNKLERMGIPVAAKDVGGSEGRTVEFHAGKGHITVRNVRGEEKSL